MFYNKKKLYENFGFKSFSISHSNCWDNLLDSVIKFHSCILWTHKFYMIYLKK